MRGFRPLGVSVAFGCTAVLSMGDAGENGESGDNGDSNGGTFDQV